MLPLFRFDPPVIPKNFSPHHKFPASLEIDNKLANPPPQEVPPPEDNTLKLLIEGVATLVARCGKLFEDLSREKNQSNPLFSFLNGGTGHDYYSRKLWEEQQKRNDRTKLQSDGKLVPRVQKMTAESRGKLLGEKPLERTFVDANSSVSSEDVVNLQVNLSDNLLDTFTVPSSFVSGLNFICVSFNFEHILLLFTSLGVKLVLIIHLRLMLWCSSVLSSY